MKKVILLSILSFSLFFPGFSQQEKQPIKASFTKDQLLAFADFKALLTAVDPGRDFSALMVRNYHMSIDGVNPDGSVTSFSESGPGGTWNEKHKQAFMNYAVKNAVFRFEKIVLVEPGKKGMETLPVLNVIVKE